MTEANAALLTDLYELTMLEAYLDEGLTGAAAFSLSFRALPPGRGYAVAAGLDDVLRFLEDLRFEPEHLAWLRDQVGLSPEAIEWLAALRFRGDVWAVPEGTPVFPHEPLLELEAPLPVAQLVESYVLNQIHLQTLLASKAARVVHAARGRRVVDFGLRRMHGSDAALKSARVFHIAGVDGTSNVLAAYTYGLDPVGTMAHSYIEAHEDEREAFRAFTRVWPETVLLVDTYDTLEGVRRVIELSKELGHEFRVRAVRLDSGDLDGLSRAARRLFDEAGLERVRILASGGLDEHQVDALVAAGAPIDTFGVGTNMGVSADAPSLDLAYKLVDYAGKGRMKTSPGKVTLPGRKQVFRSFDSRGRALSDVIARADEELPGRPLLVKVMEGGRRTAEGEVTLDEARERCARELASLPPEVLALRGPAPYPVQISEALEGERRRVEREIRSRP